MIRKVIVFCGCFIVSMLSLPILIPVEWIILLDDFLTEHNIKLCCSHEFGDERLYDMAFNTFFIISLITALIMSYLTCLYYKLRK